VIASPESWSRPADPLRATLVAVAAVAVFLGAWGLLHVGFYTREQVVDTPIYQRYGDAMADGQLPYRDFALEYPPGALPVFVLPSLAGGDRGDLNGYERAFEVMMWLCGAALLGAMAGVLDGLRASPRRVALALGFAALAPLALGSVVLSRFDLWPAALSVAALALLVGGRVRLGFALLGLAVATKVYPAVLLPLFAAFVWRRQGRRDAVVALGICAAVMAAVVVPFAVLGPDGLASSISRQLSRPLQIESLGSSFLLAAHQIFGLGITMRSGHGSQNLAGTGPDMLAVATSVLQAAALIGIWVSFARGPAERERLVRACAAAICAFIAFGKVFSPQFLIWLVPLVPLVRGRRGLAAAAVFAGALVLTQAWFPFRYWDLALRFDALSSWLVFARDLVMVGLLGVLVWPSRPRPFGPRPGVCPPDAARQDMENVPTL
jgi:glycosyl transferase family 87